MGSLRDPWLAPTARAAVRDRIVAIEKTTAAEVVVTVEAHSGLYRHANANWGALCSLAALLFYYFHPAPLPDDLFLAIAVLCYPVGALCSAACAPLRRLFAGKRTMRDNVRREARVHFVDQGISHTRGRTGVLVYVSRFERRAEVVADAGIPMQTMAAPWQAALAAIETAVRKRAMDDFLAALERMGDVLATAAPRSEDDVNELPDEVVT
jgi:putative membrane protein